MTTETPSWDPAKVPARLADLINVSSLPQIREPRNRAALEAMVRNFSSDAVRYRHSIRELLDDDHDAFLTNVVRILKSDTDSRAVQYLRSEEHTSELQSLRHLVCRL